MFHEKKKNQYFNYYSDNCFFSGTLRPFCVPAKPGCRRVAVYEACVDVLAHMTLEQRQGSRGSGIEWSQDNNAPVMAYKKSSRSAKEYMALAEEIDAAR